LPKHSKRYSFESPDLPHEGARSDSNHVVRLLFDRNLSKIDRRLRLALKRLFISKTSRALEIASSIWLNCGCWRTTDHIGRFQEIGEADRSPEGKYPGRMSRKNSQWSVGKPESPRVFDILRHDAGSLT